MGVYDEVRFSVFLWVILCVSAVCFVPGWALDKGGSICEIRGCNCTKKTSWKVVNCSFNIAQVVNFNTDHIHNDVVEIFITGGQELIFEKKSFNSLAGLSILSIGGTQQVVLEKQSMYNLTSPSLRIQIENCDRINISSGAFENSHSSITAFISQTAHCSIGKAAFSKLLNATFQHIGHLELAEGVFEFNNNKQAEITRHGPVTRIFFNNVVIPEIPRQTFFSALAEVRFENSHIKDIHSEAFKSSQISAFYLINCTINTIQSESITDRTFIINLKISKCNISTLGSKAIMAATNNLTVEFCRISEIDSSAINITAANVEIVANEIGNFNPTAILIRSWNRISVNQNIIRSLGTNFIIPDSNEDIVEFGFIGNEVYHMEEGALGFVHALPQNKLVFSDNFFDQACHCAMDKWLENFTLSANVKYLMNDNYCRVTELFSRCFKLSTDPMSIENFTELVCAPGNTIQCEEYNGNSKTIHTNSSILNDDNENHNVSMVVLILTMVGLFIIAVIATFIFLLISGGRWLKRKGYFRNTHYNHNSSSQGNDEENTIVTIVESEPKGVVPTELTLEYLQYLRERLDDENTKEETTEIIERLYEIFIVDDNYENNNRHEEEENLYEELANLQTPQAAPTEPPESNDNTRSILRLMEERFNLKFIDNDDDHPPQRPALVSDYSEPSDSAVHLYSELKQNKSERPNAQNVGTSGSCHSKSSLTSKGSGKMAFRPLPNKPECGSSNNGEAGTSFFK